MTASVETWKSYAQLLARLSPRISHILFASADGTSWWSSDSAGASRVQYALSLLLRPHTLRHREIDGLAETQDSSESRFGFRIRGALGEVLGLVVIALPAPEARLDLGAVHAAIKPALDCLQSELAARAAIGELHENLADHSRELDLFQRLSEAAAEDGVESLAQIPTLANEHLSGMVAAILLPDRNLTICRARPGQPRGIESDVLAQMHRHLMTRAQLHGCTLVTNRLALDGSNAAVPYKAISTPIRGETRRVIGVLAVFRVDTDSDFQLHDAEALELLARKAAQIIRSSFDPVTGLLTSAAFSAQTEARLAGQETGACTNGLLYVDIDQLNVVNENHGMHVGDEVIQGVAHLLSRRAREGTLVARVGGDRFSMFIPGCGIEPAARIAEELRGAAIRLSGSRGDKPLLVSLSIGVARLGDRDRHLDHALAAAELACRTAKERGRNRVEVFYGCEQSSVKSRASPSFAAQVSAALASDAFELLAQPILPLNSAPADPRFEILLRMRAADGTRLGLEKLAGVDSCLDLTRNIDRWVIERAIERLASCRELLRQNPARFSLNLSATSLADPEFWRKLEELVRKSRIEPGTLGFEFPEEAASAHLSTIAPFMCRLREQGISFALDNFGRDIASLSHLNCLPVSCIKIDGSFSRDLLDNPKSQSMVVAITKLANTFGLETVLGHVETDAIRARAAQLGVDYGQGFFIGKPLALDDAIHDLPLYSCFATSTGLFDPAMGKQAALGG
ncbi:MAG TPA: EAL domain-containing protein [Steroidobacteraceae bacterium]|nr:EAL domain-containing protein [Steroidobacteraceae bacterium]